MVNDLAWIIGSPGLMHSIGLSDVFTPTDDFFEAEFKRHLPWLHRLDENPALLRQHLEKNHRVILGKYAEELLHFFFKYSPFYNLVEHSLQIMQGNRVVGELDFLVQDKERKCFYHVEFAVKFFLSAGIDSSYRNWIGPNGKDSLSLKVDRLKDQVAASSAEGMQKIWRQNGFPTPKKALVTKGYFFYDSLTDLPPSGANPTHNKKLFFRANQFPSEEYASQFPYCVILPKLSWLAPFNFKPSWNAVNVYKTKDFSAETMFNTLNKAFLLAFVGPNKEWMCEQERVFIVKPHWPDKVIRHERWGSD